MADLRIVGLSKRFGATVAVDRVSFDVADGEFVVLVGPSGCGKSTILRMIAGLECVTDGDIFIGSRRVNDVAPRDRDVAMVFQSYALYPYKSVADNIAFPLTMRGERTSDAQAKVGRVAAILGIEELLERFPRQLSGGQRQRVAMGRAIVRDPRIFLFDEPLSNLDAKLRVVMRGQIKELQRRLKTTMVFVTHDQVEAMTMADRIVVLRDGVIEQIGRPLELYDRPANPFVAGFIGSPSMNLFKGRVVGEGEARFQGPDGLELPLAPYAGAWDGSALTLGVRPEHLDIVPPGTPGTIEADVSLVEPTGSETMIVARRGKTEIIVTTRNRPTVDSGDQIALRAEPDLLHLFGPKGRRIDPLTA